MLHSPAVQTITFQCFDLQLILLWYLEYILNLVSLRYRNTSWYGKRHFV